MTQLIVLGAVLTACAAFGFWRRVQDGKSKTIVSGEVLTAAEIGAPLVADVTLVQFSSAFCAPCRATRVLLERTAEIVPGVEHIEIDAEANLELVRKLDVRRTPTTILLDAKGQVRNRVVGVPQQDALLAAIAVVAGK